MESQHDPVTVHYTVIGGKYSRTKMQRYSRFCCRSISLVSISARRSLETTAKDGRKKAQRTLSFSAHLMFLVLDSKILISNDELGLIDLQKIITETVSKLSDI